MSSLSEKMAAEEKHALSTMTTWKRISLFVAIPICGYLTWKHLIVGEEHDTGTEYIPWSHLRIRNKPFPWGDGDTSLFHNPHANVGPEKEQEEATPSRYNTLERLWIRYLFEDPEEREERRWEHLAKMQKRKEDYLRKKAEAIDKHVPLQPMDLFTEMKRVKKNPVDSEMEN